MSGVVERVTFNGDDLTSAVKSSEDRIKVATLQFVTPDHFAASCHSGVSNQQLFYALCYKC